MHAVHKEHTDLTNAFEYMYSAGSEAVNLRD